jgi:glycosidase
VNGQFSGSMNYHGFAFLVKGFLIDGRLTAHDFGKQLEARRQDYPEPMQFALQNLIDSHDTDRVASMIVNSNDANYRQPDRFDFDVSEVVTPRSSPEYNVSAPDQRHRRIQKLVALMQMTYLGAPMIYYGTEVGMWGADDPCDRMPMVWSDLEYDDQASDPLGRPRSPDPVAFDEELFKFYQGVIKLRLDNRALRQAPFQLVAHDDAAQFLAFRRKMAGNSLLIAINRGEKDYQWSPATEENVPRRPIYSASRGHHSLGQAQLQTKTLTVPALDAVVFAEIPADE